MSKKENKRRSSIAAFIGGFKETKSLDGRRGSGAGGRRESMLFGRVSVDSEEGSGERASYKVVVLGAKKTGKTAIISQFLYDQYNTLYKETIEEMYRGEFEIEGVQLALNIQDTGGSYVYDFPSMVGVSLYSADAVLLVFALDDPESFDEAQRLRDLVMSIKGPDTPIVIVGNKSDLLRRVDKDETEATVVFDWENGYVECSAKDNFNIQAVFREILNQTKSNLDVGIGQASISSSGNSTPKNMQRRQSLPQVPAFNPKHRMKSSIISTPPPSIKLGGKKTAKKDCLGLIRLDSGSTKNKNTCKIS